MPPPQQQGSAAGSNSPSIVVSTESVSDNVRIHSFLFTCDKGARTRASQALRLRVPCFPLAPFVLRRALFA